MQVDTTRCSGRIDSAIASLQRKKFGPELVRRAEKLRGKRRYADGLSFGSSYFLRHAKHAFREGRYAAGTSAALMVPATGMVAAASFCTVYGAAINALAAGGLKWRGAALSRNDLRKLSALADLEAAERGLQECLQEYADEIMSAQALDLADLHVMRDAIQNRLENYATAIQGSEPQIRCSSRLEKATQVLHSTLDDLPEAVVRAGFNTLVGRLNVSDKVVKQRIVEGRLILRGVDDALKQWETLQRWASFLPASEQPDATQVERWTRTLHGLAKKSRAAIQRFESGH